MKGKAEDEVFVNKALIPEIIGDRVQITVILKVKKMKDLSLLKTTLLALRKRILLHSWVILQTLTKK